MKIITLAEYEWDGSHYVCTRQETEDYDGPVTLCGGGGSAPKPDPLVGQAAMRETELAEEMMDWYKTDFSPKQAARLDRQDAMNERYMNQAMAIQTKQMGYADEAMGRYRSTFQPVEDALVADANKAGSPEEIAKYGGRALTDTRRANTRNRQASEARMQAMGLNPASGNYAAVMAGTGAGDALAESQAYNTAAMAAEQLGWAKKMDAASLGRGLPSQQATATQMGLAAGSSGLGAMQQGISNWSALGNQGIGMYGQTAGMWNNAGAMAGSTYGNQLNAWGMKQSADAQEAAGIGSALGTAAMAAAVFMM